MRIVQFEAIHQNHKKPGDGVLLEIQNEPPKGMECPDFSQHQLDEEAFIIETNSPDPNEWKDCRVAWRKKYWRIELSLSIANGEKALLTLVEP